MAEVKTSVVLVDDDGYALQSLQDLLAARPDIRISGVFTSAESALAALSQQLPDLLFLDIRMPGMNGFDLLDRLGDRVPEVVFVTSYNEYAIRAIRYSALDYLLKPVSEQELERTLNRFRAREEQLLSKLRLANLRHNLDADAHEQRLVFATKQGDRQFRVHEIIRCEADSNYTRIHLVDGKKFLASKTLSDVEEMLAPESFVRIHKSHIINKAHVKNLTSGDEVVMSDASTIQISRRRAAEVRTLLRNIG